MPAFPASTAPEIAKESLHDVVGALGLNEPPSVWSLNGDRIGKIAAFLQGFITPFQEILPQVQQSVMKNIPADSLKGKLLTVGFGGLESLLKQVNENSAKYAADVSRFVESAEQRISTALNKNVTAGSRTLDERKAP